MEYALIKSGTVQNVIVADEAFITQIVLEWDHIERIDTPAEQALGVGMGWGWDGSNFVAPSAPPTPEPKPYATLIDIGPFYDRFGATKMAVLTSADPGIRAILADLNIRKWIDLARPDVAQALQYVGSVVTQVTPELQATILNTVIAPEENLALRKLYFS